MRMAYWTLFIAMRMPRVKITRFAACKKYPRPEYRGAVLFY
jgi:hypothetical protein